MTVMYPRPVSHSWSRCNWRPRALAWQFRAWAALADARRDGRHARTCEPLAAAPPGLLSEALQAGSWLERRRCLSEAFWHWQVWQPLRLCACGLSFDPTLPYSTQLTSQLMFNLLQPHGVHCDGECSFPVMKANAH